MSSAPSTLRYQFRFAPRISNIAARRLHLFDGIKPGPDVAPLIAGRIDEGLIAAHWDEMLRLGTSIRTGVVSASIMVERLGAYPRVNSLASALREIGRVKRALFQRADRFGSNCSASMARRHEWRRA